MILANVSCMFNAFSPCRVSGSQAELGPCAADITWRAALDIAGRHKEWLLCDADKACEDMRRWAKETGAWDEDERNVWSVEECLALFVQNVAFELRMLGADENPDNIKTCALAFAATDWDKRPEYPIGLYYLVHGCLHVEYAV